MKSTILLVDDDKTLRDGLQALLEEQGFTTLQADDGLEARKIIDSRHPELVIIDLMMPRWGGLAVLEHFHGRSDAPRFIMITGSDGQRYKAYAERIGVADYIHKPFTMQRLLGGVARCLGRPSAAAVPAEDPKNPATIRCRCRGCGARIKAPRQLLGQLRACPGCHRDLIVQEELPEDEGPLLLHSL